MFISTATSHDEAVRAADVAVLPVGSFEQHGRHLPLATDTLIAAAIAERIAVDYDLLLLPPIAIGASHEHADFKGTVSVSSMTLHAIVTDVAASLDRAGVSRTSVSKPSRAKSLARSSYTDGCCLRWLVLIAPGHDNSTSFSVRSFDSR